LVVIASPFTAVLILKVLFTLTNITGFCKITLLRLGSATFFILTGAVLEFSGAQLKSGSNSSLPPAKKPAGRFLHGVGSAGFGIN
jgi:hypothetical protein